jgi:beta-lactamase class A
MIALRHGALLLSLALAATVACGGEESRPLTPVAAQSTDSSPPRTSEATSPTPFVPTAGTPTLEEADPPACDDPYANGAPFSVTPDAEIRLQPSGTPTPLSLYIPLPLVRDAVLERVMRRVLGDDDEHFGIYVKDLKNGRGGTVNSNRRFYAASLYKVWTMMEVQHQVEDGILDLSEHVVVSGYYASQGLSDGDLQLCDETSLDRALSLMMSVSDNVAGNLLLERAGVANINASLRRFGMNVSGFYQDNTLPTTASEMMWLLEAIGRGQAVSEEASDTMLALLETETVDDRLPALLPDGTRVAHKAGSWSNATHDAGIVLSPNATYVIVVLTDYDFADGLSEKLAQLSRAVYDYYNKAG